MFQETVSRPKIRERIYQLQYLVTDAACEIIPSQLLPLLRPDSVGSVLFASGAPQIQFTGFDGWRYAVQVSPDLAHWTTVSTKWPVNGVFSFAEAPSPGINARFYRSVLLP